MPICLIHRAEGAAVCTYLECGSIYMQRHLLCELGYICNAKFRKRTQLVGFSGKHIASFSAM